MFLDPFKFQAEYMQGNYSTTELYLQLFCIS